MTRLRSGGVWTFPESPLFVEGVGSAASPGPEVTGEQAPRRSPGDPAAPTTPEGPPPFRHLAREAAEALGATRVGLWYMDEEEKELLCLSRFHRDTLKQEDHQSYPWPLGRALRFLLERARVLAMNDTRSSRGASGPLQEWLARERIRSLLAMPVRVRGELVGWVTWEEEGEPRAWSERDRNQAMGFADKLGGILAFWTPAREAPEPGIEGETDGDRPGPGGPVQAEAPPAPEAAPEAAPEPAPEAEISSAPSDPGMPDPEPPPGTPPAQEGSPEPARPRFRPGRREVRGELRPIPPLEGAALLGGESAAELLHLLEIQGGYLSLLDDVVRANPQDRELVEEAREAGERVRDGLLAFLRNLREGIPGREPLDLTDFLAGISGRLARLAGDQVRLRLAPASEGVRVRGNARLLERALGHLVRNARAASEPGSTIRVSWSREAVPDAPPSEAEMARIVVEDQGRGISSRELPWVFEPFFSGGRDEGEGAGVGNSGGVRGLGLPVVRAVVEGHGGWVDIRSRPGEGTQVILNLPLAPVEVDSVRTAEEADTREAPAPRILVLEDEPLLARLLERILNRSGFQATVVAAPEDARDVWRRLDGELDLVIVERTLTGERSGVEVTAPWRRERPDLQVIVLDRRALPPEDGEAPPSTIQGLPLLARPFQPADVVAAVRRALGKGAGGEGDAALASDAEPSTEGPESVPAPERDRPTPPHPVGGGPGGVVLH